MENDNPTVKTVISLLRELSDDVEKTRLEAQALSDKSLKSVGPEKDYVKSKIQILFQAFHGKKNWLDNFARQASQVLEHSSIEEASHIELQVRLRQFESALQYTSQVLNNCMNFR